MTRNHTHSQKLLGMCMIRVPFFPFFSILRIVKFTCRLSLGLPWGYFLACPRPRQDGRGGYNGNQYVYTGE